MNIFIDGKNFGRDAHLFYDGFSYSWTKRIPDGSIVVGSNLDNNCAVEHICNLCNIDSPDLLGEAQRQAFRELGVDPMSLPNMLVHRPDEFKKIMAVALEWVSEASQIIDGYSYIKTFQEEVRLLRGLRPGRLDHIAFNRWCLNHRLDNKVKNSFAVDNEGFMKKAVYNNVSTRTGRVITESGPQMLTANKEIRRFLKSRFPGGRIVQVDFVSLEPKVALAYSGRDIGSDVYASINERFFDSSLGREEIKKLLLCAIYGAGTRTLKKILPENIKPQEALSKIKDMMNYSEVVKLKRDELKKYGYMKNIFGRRVVPSGERDSIIFNNWLQSSAVDVALLGFIELLKDFDNKNLIYEPIFIIHDAIILDVNRNTSKFLNDSNLCVSLEDLGNFPLSLEYLN